MLFRSIYHKLYSEYSLGVRHDTKRCPASGRQISATTDENRDILSNLMRESRTWTTDEIATELGISHGSAHNLLVKMDYRNLASKWLHQLSCSDKKKRVEICKENYDNYLNDERVLDTIIAIDETYIRSYMPHDRHLAREWRLPNEQ